MDFLKLKVPRVTLDRMAPSFALGVCLKAKHWLKGAFTRNPSFETSPLAAKRIYCDIQVNCALYYLAAALAAFNSRDKVVYPVSHSK